MSKTELTLEEKVAKYRKYRRSLDKDLVDKVEVGLASEIELAYSFMIPPIASLSHLMGSDDGKAGGFPRGKISVVAGPEKSGKTTLLLQTLAYEMEKNPNNIYLWVDAENSFDEPYAKKLGIDFERLIFIRNGLMHDLVNRIIEMAEENIISGVIVDSVGGLTPKEEVEDSKGNKHGVEKDHMLNLQRRLGQFFRMIGPHLGKFNIPIILIAHVYQDPNRNGAFVVKGGNSLKHWGHVRLMMSRTNDDSTKKKIVMPDGNTVEVPTGHDVIIKLDKTRQNSKEGQSIVVPYRYGIGLDAIESIVSVAMNAGIVKRGGAWYNYGDSKMQGRKGVIEFFKDKVRYDKLVDEVTTWFLSDHTSIDKQTEETQESEIDIG